MSCQPRSQGLSLPAPKSERRETLAQAGHVSPRENKILRRGPFFTKFCHSLLLSVSKRGWCKTVVFFDISTMFFSSLHFAIINSSYWNINLKPKQVKCLEAIYLGRDCWCTANRIRKIDYFPSFTGAILRQNQLAIDTIKLFFSN